MLFRFFRGTGVKFSPQVSNLFSTSLSIKDVLNLTIHFFVAQPLIEMLCASLSWLVTGCSKVIYKVQLLKPLWSWPTRPCTLLSSNPVACGRYPWHFLWKKTIKKMWFLFGLWAGWVGHLGNNSRWVCQTLKSEKLWCSETCCLKCFWLVMTTPAVDYRLSSSSSIVQFMKIRGSLS